VSVSDKGSAAGPFSLSGQITNQQGQPQSQVTVQLWNMGIHPVATVTTDTNGQYSFSNLTAGGNYTVRPMATSGTVFTPGGRIYANLRRDWTNVNFTALPVTLTTYDKTVNYAYNPVGALAGVGTNLIGSDANNTSNVLNTVSFRASGALNSLNYGNGRRLTMGYNDNRSQPISMKVDRVNNPADKIIDNSYEYYMTDPETGASVNNNRIRRIVDNTGYGGDTADYYYDQYNRLTNVQGTGYFRYYLYDPFGNIKDFSAVTLNYATNATGAPATNRIQSDGVGFNYSYDEAGNMTVGMGQSFAYDGANRMKTASYGNSTYGYDGDGMRVKKTENGTTTYYVQSSALKNTAMEVTSAGVLRAYVHAGGKLTAMQATDGQFYWLHTNHLGNSRAMTDVNGNLTYKGQFDPYGQTVSEWSSSGNNNLNTKKFTGYERDVATGLDYASARMYNSGRGRFMTPDPIGVKGANFNLPQSLNQYAYVENDPINFIDPSGKLRAYSVGLCTLASITSIMDGGGASWFMSCPSIGNGNDDDIGGIGAGGSYVLGLDDSSKLRDQANDFFKDKPGCKDFINNAAKGLGVPELDSVLSKIKFIDTTVYGAPLNERMSKLGFGSQFGNKKLSEVMVTDTDRPKALANPYFGNSYYGTIFFSDKHFGDSLPMQQRTAAHEVLHVVFRGDHEKIVKSLGLTAFPADYNNDELSTLVNQFLDANCDLNKLPPHKQE
jgi:RHS repeat-associated protein